MTFLCVHIVAGGDMLTCGVPLCTDVLRCGDLLPHDLFTLAPGCNILRFDVTISSGAELYLEYDVPLCTEVLRCGDMLIRVGHDKRSGAEIC